MKKHIFAITALVCLAFASTATAQAKKASDPKATSSKESGSKYDASTFSGLELRNIGPGLVSGRVSDLAVDPRDHRVWYVAVASGGLWKSVNAGTTFEPIFDGEESYSIGCVTIDPNDSLVVWVGSGENNSQRSVAWGDGVYKSVDGGKTWKNMGLKTSEHIGKIVVDPRNSNVVYVAAQGPLWNPGGERGLYKSVDGGKTWKASLTISENTGVSDVVMDPSNPDVLYAAAYQRRRHVYTLINGGPESALYKSTDAGATWNKITAGLPKETIGRIGLAISPLAPKTVYAIVEAARKAGGVFRSTNAGASFEKMSSYVSGSPQYYQEIFVDPNHADRIYSMDVYSRVSNDGGKTFTKIDERFKHVDSHAMWIDPNNSDHFLIGCDGGLYETFDGSKTWDFKENLPITQFYRISADDALPFYHVYGGTQDNFSLGGPHRTPTAHGITNADWYITLGGDGFRSIPDPKDSNVIYAQSQNGGINRFDKRTGEAMDIQPQPTGDLKPLRMNWDSAMIVSPHKNTRLYFGAQYLFRSEDRGDTWTPVSGDLTRNINRNTLPVMGRVWGIDAVAKNTSTSYYGNIVSLAESPLAEGLLYVGTDDGLIQVSEDGGAKWRKIEKFPGVPELSYVSRLEASQHDANTVYAAFDNHKVGDFKPYVLKSTDRGLTWKSISSDLPARGTAYAVVEDFVDPKLLFVGTEFGLFFTQNGGGNWIQLKGGIPTIAVRDLWIQKRRTDLVVGTFGRGILILDDYRPLRTMSPDLAKKEAAIFPTRDAELYIEQTPLGLAGKSFQGDSFFTAPNPPFGAVFTYYLKDDLKTRRKLRQEADSKLEKDGGNEPAVYPTPEQIRAEQREIDPGVVLIVSDDEGNVIRRVSASATSGFHRVAWDLRYAAPSPIELTAPEPNPFATPVQGPLVVPGTYTARLVKRVDGVETAIAEPQKFNVVPLYLSSMTEKDRQDVLAFQRRASRLQKAILGAANLTQEALDRIPYLRRAVDETETSDPALVARINALENTLKDIDEAMNGDRVISAQVEPVPPALSDRISNAINGLVTTQPPTNTHRQSLAIAERDFGPLLARLRQAIDGELAAIEKQLNAAGAPWTPGRIPDWQ